MGKRDIEYICIGCGKFITGNHVNLGGPNKIFHIECANIRSYTFTDFSPQVISKNADESSVRCKGQQLGHNED
jgi:hypothetical protein